MNRARVLAAAAVAAVAGAISSNAQAAPIWTQVYTQTTGSGSTTTHSLRGLALSSDATSIYGGYIQGTGTNTTGAAFDRYTLSGSPPVGAVPGSNPRHFVNSVDPTDSRQAEALTTDDRGFVYGASIKDQTGSTPNARITVLSSNFAGAPQHFSLADITSPPSNTTGETIGGLDLRKDGSTYQLYVTRFRSNTAFVERYVVGGASIGSLSLTLDNTFDGDGKFDLSAAVGGTNRLRGIDVAADGTMFIASRDNNTLFKIAADLTTVSSASVSGAMDVALFGGKAYVTQYLNSASAIVELNQSNLAVTDTFTATGTFPHPDTGSTGYSGIDVDSSGRLYVADQLFVGSGGVRSDRILVSSPVPEPASLVVLGVVAPLALVRRRR